MPPVKSIFRYPGGKARLLPALSPYIDRAIQNTIEFHDAFVGGGSVLLYAAQKYPKIQLYANDLDPWIAAFWTAMNSTCGPELVERIEATIPTIDKFQELRAVQPETLVDKAFYAVFFNRTTFSGILDSGPIGGLEQQSKWKVACRYNPKRLAEGVRQIQSVMCGRLEASQEHFRDYLPRIHGSVYIDPPYYVQGPALYPVGMTPQEHAELAQIVISLDAEWVLSYDACDEIAEMYYPYAKIAKVPARYSVSGDNRQSWISKTEWILVRDTDMARDLH